MSLRRPAVGRSPGCCAEDRDPPRMPSMSRGKGGLARAVTPLLHKASRESAVPLPDASVFESVDGPRILDIPADVVSWTPQISPTGGRL